MEIYDFGVRLKELRKSKRMTQKQVAIMLQLPRSRVSEYEANIRMPTVETLQHLAIILGTTTDYMLGLKNEVVISTNGLNKSQCDTLVSVINALCAEFNKTNKTDD